MHIDEALINKILCAICRKRTHKSTLSIRTNETQCFPQISLITQTNHKTTPTTNCLCLRNNAACCIPLGYLRETSSSCCLQFICENLRNLREIRPFPPRARTQGFQEILASKRLVIDYQHTTSEILMNQVAPSCHLQRCHNGETFPLSV